MKIAVVMNPVAGPARRRYTPADADALVRRVMGEASDVSLHVTRRAGHARELARAAASAGAEVVVAWGGDGTVNEVASALVPGPVALGIVPAGSGNGLCRELRIPTRPAAALATVVDGRSRVIDAGTLNGRYFFNVAGAGIDARVAELSAARTSDRRGLTGYIGLALRELSAFEPATFDVSADAGPPVRVRALLLAVANTAQWGNNARIAPRAVPDDGELDFVSVEASSALRVILSAWRLFDGSVERMKGVSARRVRAISIRADRPVPIHVDGEPLTRSASIDAAVIAGAIAVRVPEIVVGAAR